MPVDATSTDVRAPVIATGRVAAAAPVSRLRVNDGRAATLGAVVLPKEKCMDAWQLISFIVVATAVGLLIRSC